MIRKFESEHGVIVRWTAEMDEYKEAMRIANMGKQQIVKQEMLLIARERVFYLSTLANHAGRLDISQCTFDCYSHVLSLHIALKCTTLPNSTTLATFQS